MSKRNNLGRGWTKGICLLVDLMQATPGSDISVYNVVVHINNKWGNNMERKLLKIGAASAYLGVSPGTLRKWTKLGLTPVLKSQTGRFFWSIDLLDSIRESMLTVLTNE